jgi:outer membrane protein insertion porin family
VSALRARALGAMLGAALASTPASLRADAAAGLELVEELDAERAGAPPLVVEAIELVGHERTDAAVILGRVSVEIGAPLDDDALEASRLRLLGTGYFGSVDLRLERGSRRGRVLLVVEVTERNTLILDHLFLGRSDAVPFFGGLGVEDRNFLGRGVAVGGGFVAARDRRALTLRTFVPDLSDTPLQLSGSLVHVEGVEQLDPGDPATGVLRYRRTGGTVGLGLAAGPSRRVSLVYRLEALDARGLEGPARPERAPSIRPDDSVLSTLTAGFELDTRDDPFLPAQGTRIAVAAEVGTSLLGSSYEFSKYTAELEHALNPAADHTLTLRLLGGMLQGESPFFNQFFAGDWAYATLGRRVLPRPLQLNVSTTNDHDDLLAFAALEYTIPVLATEGPLHRAHLYFGVDVGATASLGEVQQDRDGRGAGTRFPLSLDAGLKLDTALGPFTLSLAYLATAGVP